MISMQGQGTYAEPSFICGCPFPWAFCIDVNNQLVEGDRRFIVWSRAKWNHIINIHEGFDNEDLMYTRIQR